MPANASVARTRKDSSGPGTGAIAGAWRASSRFGRDAADRDSFARIVRDPAADEARCENSISGRPRGVAELAV